MFLGRRDDAENRGNVEKNGMDSKVSEPGFAGLEDDQDGAKKR